jgi:polyphosphate kinase
VDQINWQPIPAITYAQEGLPFIHRDVSWLSFNHRVLQEALDPNVPLFERIKFLAIYSSNLDEFFKVRMAYHRYLFRVGRKTKRELDVDSKIVIRELRRIVNMQQEIFSHIFDNMIIPELRQHQIFMRRRLELDDEQKKFVEDYFRDNLQLYVQPVLLLDHKIRPFLNNGALYLTLWMSDKASSEKTHYYGLVKIPSDQLPRFVPLPSPPGRFDFIMLDDIVRHSVSRMYPGFEIIDTFSVKLTRDAELYIEDEFSGDLIGKIRKSLIKRHVGPPSRLVYDREMPDGMLDFLKSVFDLGKYDTLREGRYHNNADFFRFPDFGVQGLRYPPLNPVPYSPLESARDLFGELRRREHLLFFPFHAYEPVLNFFEKAARDPRVTHIKLTQYRVARNSRIMHALIAAAQAGKQVSVFVEVKARFDEEANLNWGERLQAAGVTVHYSLPGVKVHAKLALVRRLEKEGPQMYVYLSTGNFHEDTAKVYTDMGLFTADQRISSEVLRIFAFLEDGQKPAQDFEHLLVGQFNLRPALVSLINKEIAAAKEGKKALIILKMNSLEDRDMVEKLYEASRAGVQIRLIVRSICSLAPGIPGHSENIHAVSIVDRFLEHARVFYFCHGGEDKIYLSSADWMVRNLNYRIETAFPIYDPEKKQEILDYLNIQLGDNLKARILDIGLNNCYQKNQGDIPIRSQYELYYYMKRK